MFLESDLQAMRCGMHSEMYHHLGAHPEIQNGQAGVRFAVWAPNAREVSVLSDHTHWTHGRFWLNSSNEGIWNGFVPGMKPGMAYKYGLTDANGNYEADTPHYFGYPNEQVWEVVGGVESNHYTWG